MVKELELAKKLVVLGWIYRNKLISEAEYVVTKNRIMREYGMVSFIIT